MESDPIEQLAAELLNECVPMLYFVADGDCMDHYEGLPPFLAKLIKVAVQAGVAHMEEVYRECEKHNASCWADICQRIREGMGK